MSTVEDRDRALDIDRLYIQHGAKPRSLTPCFGLIDTSGNAIDLGADAFSRLRVSQPHELFSGVLDHDDRSDIFETVLTNNATTTYDGDSRTLALDTTTTDTDRVIRQTYIYWPYRAGEAQLILMTYAMGAWTASTEMMVGYFDDDNGVFVRRDDTADTKQIVLRSKSSGSIVDTQVAQADWNEDTLDGTGPSGIIIDWTKVNILVIELQWLGSGIARVAFDVDGVLILAHTFRNSNILTTTYMGTGSLPCRYEIRNTGVATASTLTQICCSVQREGGPEEPSELYAIDMAITPYTATTTLTTLIGVRLKSTHNRGIFALPNATILVTGAQPVRYVMLENVTVAGTPSWTSTNGNSLTEYTIHNGAVTLTADTHVIASGYINAATGGGRGVSQEVSLAGDHLFASTYDGTARIGWLAVQSITSTSDVLAHVHIREFR